MDKNGTIIKDFQLASETEEDYILSKEIKEKINEGNEMPVEVLEIWTIKKLLIVLIKIIILKKN